MKEDTLTESLTQEVIAPMMTAADRISAILSERAETYGTFVGHAKITQAVKQAMRNSPNWAVLSDSQQEALEMIAHKIGRILNGDPNFQDSWDDLVGYARLIADELQGVIR